MSSIDPVRTVAVVGMGCRFPGASGTDAFWKNLTANTDSITPIPSERFDAARYHSTTPGTPGRTVSRHGGFLDDPFSFDAPFFGISPAEAALLDPQHRLLLPVVWEALEDAGIAPSALAGSSTGVYIGQATGDYADTGLHVDPTLGEATGSRLRSMAAGRISYALDLRGPSMTIDTACSSSLVAVHTARQSLLSGEAEVAVAGGVNVILSPRDSIAYSQAEMLSPDGRCKFGDAGADGFVRSEGIGVVVLKPLPAALRDGDRVLALLPGSAVTNDGRGSGLLLKPAVSGQTAMFEAACRDAGVRPGDLDYVEAHGTGTPVGDAVELRALAAAVAGSRTARRPLRTGSVKSNIGHTEAAAGIAGLIKAVLAAHHGTVPASLHHHTPNPVLADLPVSVVTRNEPLGRGSGRALLGVSSFGLSGTNAHVVVAEHLPEPAAPGSSGARPRPALPAAEAAAEAALLVLSARSPAALERLAARYADFLGPDGAGRDLALAEVCAAAALRRDAHPYRLWVTGSAHDELAAGLRELARGGRPDNGGAGPGVFGPGLRTVFVFPGQGSQWPGMGRALLESSAAFREALEACDAAVREEAGWSVLEVLRAPGEDFPDDVGTVQPVLWAMEVALAAYWREAGVTPDVCVGHSMGEVAAAVVAGGLGLRDGAAVICRRSALMRSLAGRGAMLATELSADRARELARSEAGGTVCVAAENAPESTVLSGERAGLERLARRLDERGVFHRPVRVNVASHSPLMDGITGELLEALADVAPVPAHTALYSTLRGTELDGPELDARYWVDNLREPVLFHGAVSALAKDADAVFVEISPHPVLQAALEDTLAAAGSASAVTGSTRRGRPERAELARSLGRVFAAGGRVRWERWFRNGSPHVPLPGYPWDEEHLRRPGAAPGGAFGGPEPAEPAQPAGLGSYVRHFGPGEDLVGVRVRGLDLVAPVVSLAVLHAAAAARFPGGALIRDVRVGADPVPAGAGGVTLGVRLDDAPEGRPRPAAVRAAGPAGGAAGAPAVCLSAWVEGAGPSASGAAWYARVDEALGRCRDYRPAPEFFASAARREFEIAPAFRTVRRLWTGPGEAVAHVDRPDAPPEAAWEACLLPLLAAVGPEDRYRPVAFDTVRFHGPLPEDFWVHCSVAPGLPGREARADVVVAGPDGRPVAEFGGIRLHRLETAGVGDVTRWLSDTALRFSDLAVGTVADLTQTPRRVFTSALAVLRPSFAAAPPVPAGAVARPGPHLARPVPEAADGAGPAAAGPHPLVTEAARVLVMEPARIDVRRPLRDYGLDSLMAAQLRGRLAADHGIAYSVGQLLGTLSVERLIAVSGH
ncbi:beta-ketoacyl synthase N-terminal-like domain-containing protein [Streptomyces subrutilus]|uniref:type I polyketide synthase n=1 Tax=Streptomyces subrutilus TaxID=36818 RepID=UPI00342ED730